MNLDIIPTWTVPYDWYRPAFSSSSSKNFPIKKSKTGITLVLDVDETMVHTMDEIENLKELGVKNKPEYLPLRKRIYDFWIDDPETGEREHVWGVTRPHLWEFLTFACSNPNPYFKEVIVWSSGNRGYVNAVCDFIWQDLPRPKTILTADDCALSKSGVYGKPLKILYDIHPELSPDKTVIIDDLEKNRKHNKENGILIPQYKPEPTLKDMNKDDTCLLDIIDFFSSPAIKSIPDIRLIDKNKIFT